MDQKVYAGGFDGQPVVVLGEDGRRATIGHTPGMNEWLGARSEAFADGTQRKGAPMVYGSKIKS